MDPNMRCATTILEIHILHEVGPFLKSCNIHVCRGIQSEIESIL